MAGSTKAELAANSFDGSNFGSGFSNGQRGTLSRSGSFRNAAMSSAEIPHANQYMSLEPYGTNDLKNVRSGELRRVLGVSLEDHLVGFSHWKPLPPVSWEELKRFKGNIEENSSRAKDRVKSLQDSVLKLDRYRNLISKKHQRIENQSNDRSSNSNVPKTGNQAHQRICENLNPKLEKKTRNSAPNKRARSSITEAQATSSYSLQSTLPSRQGKIGDANKSAPVDKDKHTLRSCNGASIPVPPAGLKRRRSLGLPQWNNTRIQSDGDRDLKHSTNVRVRNDSHPRSSDSLGFRSGLSNGNAESGNSQLSSGSSHILPGIEFGNGLLSNDRRERTSLKGSYKMNTSEDGQFGNQSPLTRGKASRPCRTSSSVPMSSCKPDFSCAPVATIDKTKWAAGGQRSRGKNSNNRKTNAVSPVSNLDDASQSDDHPVGPIVESGVSLFSRDSVPNTTLNLKSKNEISDIHEVEKRIDNSGIEGRSVNVPQKVVSLLPIKKKVTGDGVRRQGRSGRGTVQSKACPQMNKEKSVDLDTTKPTKSRKLVLDKLERASFPLSKKASERKGPNRCGQSINFSPVELEGESDDDREELLAAAKAVNDGKCTGPFWESMEPIFSPVKQEEFSLLKHQVTHNDERLENDMPAKEIIPLSQRLLSSLITEAEIEMMDGDVKAQHEISHYSHGGSPYNPNFTQPLTAFHTNTSCNGFTSPTNFSSSGNFPQENGYVGNSDKWDAGIVHSGFIQDWTNHVQYEKMSLDDKVLIELHSIGIYPDTTINPDEEYGNEMDKVISELTNALHQQMTIKNNQLCRLEKVILEQKESEMRNLEQLAMNELAEKAYNKLVVGRQKNGSSKVSKLHALAFAKRTIARCQKFEETGQSCFREPFLRDALFPQSGATNLSNNMDGKDTVGTAVISSAIASNAEAHDTQSGSRILTCDGSPQILDGHGSPQNIKNKDPLDSHQRHNNLMVQSLSEKGLTIIKEEKKDVIDDAVTITPTLQYGAKQKQPQEDPIRDSVTKNCSEKNGTSKGEQKTKSMQKIAQLPSSENCHERMKETASVMPNIASEDAPNDTTKSSANELSEDKENNMLFTDNIDELGEFGHDDDIDSWLNIVDDSIQDTEFVGLQIPMDDLSDIKLDF